MLLETNDVPKYIRELIKNAILLNEPYKIKIISKHKVGGEKGFNDKVDKLINWCKKWHAEVTIVENGMWWKKYQTASSAYAHGHHNYFVLEVTDPVMNRWEKDNMYRN